MEVLLREFGEEYYVWKEATYNKGEFALADDSSKINQINILAIRNDNRNDFVECAHCGEIIHNDPKSIEAHFAAQEAKRDCFHCSELSYSNIGNINVQYIKNDDEIYTRTAMDKVKLYCGKYSWNRSLIDSPAADATCKYTQCRRKGVKEISDIFAKYPDLFDKQATVDALNEKNSTYEGYSRGFFVYDLKCHNAVKAYVNPLGIINHFTISFRTHTMIAFYSAKYDEIFFKNGEEYSENVPYDISDTRYNQAKAKISALYKEA